LRSSIQVGERKGKETDANKSIKELAFRTIECFS
jgi:hypothetical protein